MYGKPLSVGISLFFAMSGACLAATSLGQGVIRFQGSIVESSCGSHVGANSTVELSGCSTSAQGSAVSARSVEPVSSVSAPDHSRVDVKLVKETRRDGRYYDQQYTLVDGAGKPVNSGTYLITLTAP
ncbi:type 1 fimbrial protein [Pseudomonas sp. TH31]|uniref:type 1 fimbrial protein n=1 Tax=Pseudomonas sp. TH31 TaxID=2796396 RepID=UPI001913A199|nr:type 1 fimbrial protein [Pseudomonas sp. TH31]MBK5416653.1 type 1 fimbrial protein [Pseudomonas sp. TH31]